MLTYHDLVLIERALREQTVLTVYINGEERDPSKRSQWRIELRHALDDIDRWLSGSSHTERESFAARRALGYLVVDIGDEIVKGMLDGVAYPIAETAYALAIVESP